MAKKAPGLERKRSAIGGPFLYHVKDGLHVGKDADGKIIIELRASVHKDAAVIFRTSIEPCLWASAFAQVSHGGPTDDAVEACLNLIRK